MIMEQTSAQNDQIKFKNISVEQGLSQSTINCILQDSKGFMWFGTQDGLNKYDGYTFEVYKHQPRDTNTLSHNWIWDIYEDEEGMLWIATWQGFSKYDPYLKNFTRYFPKKDDINSISNSRPTSIAQDNNGNLWIGTWGGGINIFDSEREVFYAYQNDPNNNSSLSNNFVRDLYIDSQNRLWIGTWDGLCCLIPDSIAGKDDIRFKRYLPDQNNRSNISGNQIVSISGDKYGDIWIGTMQSGLNRFNNLTKKFIHYKYDIKIPASINSNRIGEISPDSFGNLWVGTQDRGLNRYIKNDDGFLHYTMDGNRSNNLSSNAITAIYEDRSGNLWIGTETNGLNILNLREKKFSHYQQSGSDNISLSGNLVRSFYEDENNHIWIGTQESGLNHFSPATGEFRHFKYNPGDQYSISHNNIQTIVADNSGKIWIGTFGGGLNQFDPKSKKFFRYKHNDLNDKSIGSDFIEALLYDPEGNLWIGTASNGLDKYDLESNEITHYKFDENDPFSISTNYILSLYQDSQGRLWIGGWGGGLNLYNHKNQQFTRFVHNPKIPHSLCDNIVNSIFETQNNGKSTLWVGTAGGLSYMSLDDSTLGIFNHYFESDGLPNQHIYGILRDKNGDMWISTNNGLSKFAPPDNFENFNIADGLATNEFSGGAYYQCQDGRLLFGSSKGFISFYSDSIEKNMKIPPIIITNFKKFNKNVNIGKHISYLKDLQLIYTDNVFSFEFSALDFTAPMKNQYAYKMDGFHKEWIFTDSKRRSATFTNLDPGEYTFWVRGSNNDGIWNEKGTSIEIIISPPFWSTWWFRLILGMIIVTVIFIAYYFRIQHLKKLHKKQEEFSARLMESQELERKRIASELHDSLGQNLLIINNEIQQYAQRAKADQEELQQISATVKESINEVREISYNLHPHQLDRLGLTKAIESSINKVAHASDIKFNVSIHNIDQLLSGKNEIHLFRIVQEAITNILKHSHADFVDIKVRTQPQQIILEIKDNGHGFVKREQSGNIGLGLSDMSERAKLISADIQINSEPGYGTTIKVRIPI